MSNFWKYVNRYTSQKLTVNKGWIEIEADWILFIKLIEVEMYPI